MKKKKYDDMPGIIRDEVTLYPTGTCFEDVTQYFAQLVREDNRRMESPNFFTVHGICIMSDGTLYSHAWVEENGHVWFPAIFNGERGFAETTVDDFYKEFKVQDCTKYSFFDLVKMSMKTPRAKPPYEEKYRRLCHDYVEKK